MHLSQEEARVVGSLIEKQLTTPQQYPLTLNALVLACNQSSNRDPVVEYEERVVEQALSSLKDAGLVRFVYPSHGRSVTRYRQVLEERLALDQTELALLAVLLLRGPQTVGELRARCERLATFDDIAAVESELRRLSERPEPLVAALGRRPGQKEERWTQLVADEPERAERPEPVMSRSGDRAAVLEDVAGLRAEVAELRADLAELRADLEALRTAFERLRHDLGA